MLCEGHFNVTEIFSDEQSGAKLNRPGLQSAFDWLEQDADRVLIFYKVDRYARTLDKFETIRKYIDNGQVYFMNMAPPGEPQNMMMLQMMLVFAEQERRLLANRVSSTIQYLKRQGRSWGGTEPHLSTIREKSQQVRSSNADEFGINLMNKISLIAPSKRSTLKDLVDTLNKLEITTPRGKTWTSPALCRTLKRLERRGVAI